MPFTLKIAARLFLNGEKCFGPGTAELLERVEREGSLRKAAAGMRMAYSKAWYSLRECERVLGFPLLEKKTGGKGGGCSYVTPRGRMLLEKYRSLEKRLSEQSRVLLEELDFSEKPKEPRQLRQCAKQDLSVDNPD